jgi:hypothetical protein
MCIRSTAAPARGDGLVTVTVASDVYYDPDGGTSRPPESVEGTG